MRLTEEAEMDYGLREDSCNGFRMVHEPGGGYGSVESVSTSAVPRSESHSDFGDCDSRVSGDHAFNPGTFTACCHIVTDLSECGMSSDGVLLGAVLDGALALDDGSGELVEIAERSTTLIASSMTGVVLRPVKVGETAPRFIGILMDRTLFRSMLSELSPVLVDLAAQFGQDDASAFQLHTTSLYEDVRQAAERMAKCDGQTLLERLRRDARVLEMLSVALTSFMRLDDRLDASIRQADVARIVNARDLLLEDISADWSLEKLARRVGLNVKKLKIGFRTLVGKTVFSYLREQRLLKAEALLRENDLNIDQAAYMVGYSSTSHFSQVFRKRFGCCPSTYRMQFRSRKATASGVPIF